MIAIITEKLAWNANIKLAVHSDFYHTYDYHLLSKKENETPILIKYSDENSCVLLPLLIRDIENTDYRDATSVYGYAGLLYLSEISNFNKEKFKKELNQYFLEQKIVSVFSRLHPYLNHQEEILDNIGCVSNPGDIVCIDLNEPLDIQRQYYSSRLKTHINKADRMCTIIKGETEEHLKAFIEIYYENMRRVRASEAYFFSKAYFDKLMASTDFETELSLALCSKTQEIIAGALFMKTDNIVQYHLSGTKKDFLDYNAIKLIIDKMRIKCTNDGYEYLNLGGGRSNKQDSLFDFKASFSDTYKPFKLWKYIADEKVYKELVKQHNKVAKNADFEVDEEFFPSYRKPRFHFLILE